MGSRYLMDTEFQFYKRKKFQKLVAQQYKIFNTTGQYFRMVRMVNFMFYVFNHNLKNVHVYLYKTKKHQKTY